MRAERKTVMRQTAPERRRRRVEEALKTARFNGGRFWRAGAWRGSRGNHFITSDEQQPGVKSWESLHVPRWTAGVGGSAEW